MPRFKFLSDRAPDLSTRLQHQFLEIVTPAQGEMRVYSVRGSATRGCSQPAFSDLVLHTRCTNCAIKRAGWILATHTCEGLVHVIRIEGAVNCQRSTTSTKFVL